MVPPSADIIIAKHVLLRWLEIHTEVLTTEVTTLFFLPFEVYFLSVSFQITQFSLAAYSLSLNIQTGCRNRRGKPKARDWTGGEGSSCCLTFSLIGTT